MKLHHSLIIAGAVCGALALPAFGESAPTPTQPTATQGHPMQLAWCRWGRCGYGYGYRYGYRPYYRPYYRHCWWRNGYRYCN